MTFELVNDWCGAHQEQISEHENVQSTLERFVENDPDDRMSRIGLARLYRQLRWYDRAKECLAGLSDSDPGARACRAEIEFDRGDVEAVTSLLADGPRDDAKLARLRGRLALGHRAVAEAVRWFRLSDAAEPNHSETLYELAQALRLIGDRAAAEPLARRAEAHRVLLEDLAARGSGPRTEADRLLPARPGVRSGRVPGRSPSVVSSRHQFRRSEPGSPARTVPPEIVRGGCQCAGDASAGEPRSDRN